jgi:2-hydroxymethylglutarate dehydrogenase
MDPKIGFVGVGAMGKPMAKNLLKAGFTVMVHDKQAEAVRELTKAGAAESATLEGIAKFATHIITMLPASKEVTEVYLGAGGLLAHAKAGQTWIDMSTHEPASIVAVGREAAARGVDILDAPVSGGTFGAEAGTLAIMVGGERDVFERCQPILQAMGKNVVHCGDLGAGEVVKLVNNWLAAVNMLGVVEAFVTGVKAGVDATTLRKVICVSSGQSYALETYLTNKGLKGDFEPGFTVDLMHKDLSCALALADEVKVPCFLGPVTRSLFGLLQEAGLGKKDTTVSLAHFESLAKTTVRVP